MSKIIDEIREITAGEVAKKQDKAKLNFPLVLEKIKRAAKQGKSHVNLAENEINEFDRKLLVMEGFSVQLITKSVHPNDAYKRYLDGINIKVWEIQW